MTSSSPPEIPWYAAFPSPETVAGSVSIAQVRGWLEEPSGSRRDFVLIDLRRMDFEGGSIRGSINLPAQSLFSTIPSLYSLFAQAGLKKIIWYCGSSTGRGSRAAGWFADHIRREEDFSMESLVMTGGIKGWVNAGDDYVNFMDNYDPSKWSK